MEIRGGVSLNEVKKKELEDMCIERSKLMSFNSLATERSDNFL